MQAIERHDILFSAYAEVFPMKKSQADIIVAFLCLRRGVSPMILIATVVATFSLPTQRCFFSFFLRFHKQLLFSAYAEVFLFCPLLWAFKAPFSLPTQRCFPHGG